MEFKVLMFKDPPNADEISFAKIDKQEGTGKYITYVSGLPEFYGEEVELSKLKEYFDKNTIHSIHFDELELVDVELKIKV